MTTHYRLFAGANHLKHIPDTSNAFTAQEHAALASTQTGELVSVCKMQSGQNKGRVCAYRNGQQMRSEQATHLWKAARDEMMGGVVR